LAGRKIALLRAGSGGVHRLTIGSARSGTFPGLSSMMYGISKMLGKKPLPLESGVLANIGNLLRVMYDSALKEPVPERLVDLLRQMDAKTDGTPPPPEVKEQPAVATNCPKRPERGG
jgi:Anti-sigma factor NepR